MWSRVCSGTAGGPAHMRAELADPMEPFWSGRTLMISHGSRPLPARRVPEGGPQTLGWAASDLCEDLCLAVLGPLPGRDQRPRASRMHACAVGSRPATDLATECSAA